MSTPAKTGSTGGPAAQKAVKPGVDQTKAEPSVLSKTRPEAPRARETALPSQLKNPAAQSVDGLLARHHAETKPRTAGTPDSESSSSAEKHKLKTGRSVRKDGEEPQILSAFALSESAPKTSAKQAAKADGLAASDSGQTRAAEGRLQGGKGDDPGLAARIRVLDLRKAQPKEAPKEQVQSVEASAPRHFASETGGGVGREIFMDLSKTGQGMPTDRPPGAQDAAPSGQNFAATLADRLRDTGNTEIVQSARIILKDGDSGAIRMRLNPPELGNVKIELQLADNSISGKIIVGSEDAKSAFEKGLADLRDAFTQSGFESAKLEVQVGSGDTGGQAAWNGGGHDEAGRSGPFWSERSRSEALEATSSAMGSLSGRAERAVDIVV